MKTNFYITVFALLLIMTSCSDSFLETRPSQFISGADIEAESELDPSLQDANLQGLYTLMFDMWTGGTEGHDDFGHKGYEIFTDMLTGDVVLSGYNYGWYQGIVEYTWLNDFSNNRNYTPWRYYYRMIFGANNIIDGLGGSDNVPELEEGQWIMGQAKTMRAFAYFNLANMYGIGSYQTNQSQGVLPIYTSGDQEAQPLSTGAEVYNQITKDLEDAVSLLSTYSRSAINEVDVNIAKGYLAYAYAAMHKYDEVKRLTQEIIDSGEYSLLSAEQLAGPALDKLSSGGFNNVETYSNSWMWGTDITLDHDLDLVSWWGQMDPFTYSYAYVGDYKSINYELYLAIPDSDIRKQQFLSLGDEGHLFAGNKFYAPGGRSTGTLGEQRLVTTDYLYLRIEEMYMLNAEASAQLGDMATARQKLADLLEIRMPNDYEAYLSAISDGDLLDEIYFQTRIEFFEEGKSYLAFKRLEKTQNLGSNHLTFPGEQISYDEQRVSFKIPEREVLNNPNL